MNSSKLGAAAKLGFELVQNNHTGPKRTVVFLHGILGSLKNWKTPARKIVDLLPHYQALVVDHRGHGRSEAGSPPHSLDACANDVHQLLRSIEAKPDIICGHSFGGKIALAYAKIGWEKAGRNGWIAPRQTWVFDSLPGKVARHKAIGENSVAEIIQKLTEVKMPYPDKKELLQLLIKDKEIPPAIANWLMTSIDRADDGKGVVWAFQLPVVQELFNNYVDTDYYDLLENFPENCKLDFIRAGKNTAWTKDVLKKFDDIKVMHGKTNVNLHTLPNAGHWIHVDDPQGMIDLIEPSFAAGPEEL